MVYIHVSQIDLLRVLECQILTPIKKKESEDKVGTRSTSTSCSRVYHFMFTFKRERERERESQFVSKAGERGCNICKQPHLDN